MRRGIFCLVFSFAALAQPPVEPIQTALQDYWRSPYGQRIEEGASKRTALRPLLAKARADSPQFADWAQQVAQIYQSAGKYGEGMAILEDAVARLGRSGDGYAARARLLSNLANLWQQDRNLLKAAKCLEEAIATLEASPAQTESSPRTRFVIAIRGNYTALAPPVDISEATYFYQNLASLYRRLGRADDAAAVAKKIEARLKSNDSSLASFYADQGRYEEAAAVYKHWAESASGDPQQAGSAFQAMAYFYQGQERYADAANAMQRALAAWEYADTPAARGQTSGLRLNLARMLNQAGDTEAAERIFQQMLAESANGRDWEQVQAATQYASHLVMTERASQAEQMLKAFLASHTNLEPGQESTVLYSLSNAARAAGNEARAVEYQRAATAKNTAIQASPPGQVLIAGDLQKAQEAAQAGREDEAFGIAVSALDAASRAADRDQVVWRIPSIAAQLAPRHLERADQLYSQLFSVVETWPDSSAQPLINTAQSYARFLMYRRDRLDDARMAIRRYREILMAVRGAGTGWQDDALRMGVELEDAHGAKGAAVLLAQELAAFQETHNGATSEPYLEAIQTLANLYESNGAEAQAAALRRQAIAIVDLICLPTDVRRAMERLMSAEALARHGGFDQAEQLADEAVAIAQTARPKPPADFANRIEEVRRMRTAPRSAGRWFSAGFGVAAVESQ